MTIDECVDSWTNGNLSTVVDHVISRNSPAEVAYYAAAVACKLPPARRSAEEGKDREDGSLRPQAL